MFLVIKFLITQTMTYLRAQVIHLIYLRFQMFRQLIVFIFDDTLTYFLIFRQFEDSILNFFSAKDIEKLVHDQ